MMKAAMQVLNENKPVWENIKPIAVEITDMAGLLAAIAAEGQMQYDSQTAGHTNRKDRALETMNSLGFKTSLKVSAWARKSGNEVVLAATNFRKWEFERGSESEQVTRNTTIAGIARQHLASLADYKITAEGCTALEEAIQAALPLTAVRDAVGSNRQAATGGLALYIKAATDILIHLDGLVEGMLEDEHRAFEDAYFAARKVHHRRGGSVKPEPIVNAA